eukprot:bmy_17646T0
MKKRRERDDTGGEEKKGGDILFCKTWMTTKLTFREDANRTITEKDAALAPCWPPPLRLGDRTPGALLVRFRQPSASGLSQDTSSLYISNGVAASDKLMLSCNQITVVINASLIELEYSVKQEQNLWSCPAQTSFTMKWLPNIKSAKEKSLPRSLHE